MNQQLQDFYTHLNKAVITTNDFAEGTRDRKREKVAEFAYCELNDLLPTTRTSHFSKKSINPENDGHESKQIQRRKDHWISAAGGRGHADQGDRAQTRFQ